MYTLNSRKFKAQCSKFYNRFVDYEFSARNFAALILGVAPENVTSFQKKKTPSTLRVFWNHPGKYNLSDEVLVKSIVVHHYLTHCDAPLRVDDGNDTYVFRPGMTDIDILQFFNVSNVA